MFQLSKFFPLGGWGGPEKDRILQHCLVEGLAIVCYLVLGPASRGVPRSDSGLMGCDMVLVVSGFNRSVRGGSGSVFFMTFPFNFHVHAQGTSGSSVLSEESWLGSTGDMLLASGISAVLFFPVRLLLLTESPCFSSTFFFLAYCLPPTLCSHFLDIALCMALNNNPHFLATSLIFLA